jgi:hypothetical protein
MMIGGAQNHRSAVSRSPSRLNQWLAISAGCAQVGVESAQEDAIAIVSFDAAALFLDININMSASRSAH